MFFIIFQDAHESDSDKDVEDSAAEEEQKMQKDTNAEPKVSSTERTVQTPAETQREMDPRQHHIISRRSEGADCCKPQDSDKEQLCKLRSGFAHGCVSPPGLNRNVWDPTLFHPAQLHSWYSYATVDAAVQSGLSLAAPVRTPGPAGFPVSFQQHTLVQVHRGLTKQLLN